MKRNHPKIFSTYNIWLNMRDRCNNQGNSNWEYYGGRGIKVCERWNEFDNFVEDMGIRPAKMTIERKDNLGDYSPENCVWATRKEQARNRRSNRLLTWNGETKHLVDWAKQYGINVVTLHCRLSRNMTLSEALTMPLHRGRRDAAARVN